MQQPTVPIHPLDARPPAPPPQHRAPCSYAASSLLLRGREGCGHRNCWRPGSDMARHAASRPCSQRWQAAHCSGGRVVVPGLKVWRGTGGRRGRWQHVPHTGWWWWGYFSTRMLIGSGPAKGAAKFFLSGDAGRIARTSCSAVSPLPLPSTSVRRPARRNCSRVSGRYQATSAQGLCAMSPTLLLLHNQRGV